MPFRKSAKIELVHEGTLAPGDELWRLMPCYSYVIYRTEKKIPTDTAYFHSAWRQEGLLLGKQDNIAPKAKGKGRFIGWNVTVRHLTESAILAGRDPKQHRLESVLAGRGD